ncbi:TetR/AcrR family transcriptional regulator [Gordonia hydrophobica]|uniref:Helix-turn-helix domain-containing protein n=1 Tax=Gordonia hydrophobica TaxID=40516 RepID=A0ABZ2U2I1_9ACTN|nr:TetR/AcrR family transcriptional regulator [Gordonia hydrophobica]MBM7369066.1 AcrR family transcriptional regulator [Gordonia hydrophobica]
MGRNQTFDTDDVIRAARGVFWARGFEGASLPELERATGLSRSSIYHAFGSKRGLFDAAVDSYLGEVVRPRLRPLTGGDVDPEAIDQYLAGLRAALLRAGTLPATSGCLLVNTAGAPIGHDAAVAHVISAYAAELRTAFTAGVRARLPHLTAATQEAIADACTSHVITAFTLVRIDPDIAAQALDAARNLLAVQQSA